MTSSNRAAAHAVASNFVQLYQKFVKLHNKNTFNEILLIIPDIPIALLADNYAPHYSSLLTSCLGAVARCSIAVQPEWTQHLCAAFAHLLAMQPTLDKLCTAVGDLDRSSTHFAALAVHGICLRLAECIRARLEALLLLQTTDGQVDAQHVAIYRCLLVLLRLEMASVPSDPQTVVKYTHTLQAIAALKRCAGKLSEFRKSLNTLLLLLLVCQQEGSAAVLVAWVRRWKLPAEPVEVDVANDLQLNTLMTAVQMLSSVRISTSIDAGESTNLLRFLLAAQTALLGVLPRAINFTRISCYHCKSNAIRHECIAIGEVAAKIMHLKLTATTADGNDLPTMINEFSSILFQAIGAARSLQCPNGAYVLDRAQRTVLHFPANLKQHKCPSALTWDFLRRLCSAADQLALPTVTDLLSISRLCTELLAVAPTVEESMTINYIHVSHLLSQPDYPSVAVEQRCAVALQRICVLQNGLADIFDIDTHLAGIGYTWHGLSVPRLSNPGETNASSAAPAADLLLQLFQYAFRRSVLSSALRQQLMELIVRTVPVDRPLQALRISNGFLGYALSSTVVYDGLAAAYARAKRHQVEYARHTVLKRRWYAAVANMEAIEYLRLVEAQLARIAAMPSEAVDLRQPAQCTLFRRPVNLQHELQLLRRVQLALRWYGKFVAKLADTDADRVQFAAETWNALEALNQLGEHCDLRGYRSEAWQAYQLLLQLARKADGGATGVGGAEAAGRSLGRVQAITHLAWNRADCVPDVEAGETLAQALRRLHADVTQCASEELPAMMALGAALSRRRQGAALHCLLAVARYQAEASAVGVGSTGGGGELPETRELLQLSERLLVGMEQQYEMPESNVFRIRYYAVLLRLITHHGLTSPFPPIVFAETMLRMCHRLHFQNGDGVTKFKCLLFEFMVDVTEYCVARYDFGEVLGVLLMLLKMAARDALAGTAGRLLALWTQVELCKENASEAEAVLGLLDDCLAVFDAVQRDAVPLGTAAAASVAELTGGMQKLSVAQAGGAAFIVSPVRNVGQPQRISPIREFRKGIGIATNKYLISHPPACECPICRTPFGQLLLFDVATLHCRLSYVKGDLDQALGTVEQTYDHHSRLLSATSPAGGGSAATTHMQSLIGCRLCWYYAHSLWRTGQLPRAADLLRTALELSARSPHPDVAIVQDLKAQLTALDAEQNDRSAKVPINARRAFAVDVDELLRQLTGTSTTTAITSTKVTNGPENAVKPMRQREPSKIAKPVLAQLNGRTAKTTESRNGKPSLVKAPTIQVYLSDDSDMDTGEPVVAKQPTETAVKRSQAVVRAASKTLTNLSPAIVVHAPKTAAKELLTVSVDALKDVRQRSENSKPESEVKRATAAASHAPKTMHYRTEKTNPESVAKRPPAVIADAPQSIRQPSVQSKSDTLTKRPPAVVVHAPKTIHQQTENTKPGTSANRSSAVVADALKSMRLSSENSRPETAAKRSPAVAIDALKPVRQRRQNGVTKGGGGIAADAERTSAAARPVRMTRAMRALMTENRPA